MMCKHFYVWFAYVTNNFFGKRADVFGRSYSYVYKKFGHKSMVNDFLDGNSWCVKSVTFKFFFKMTQVIFDKGQAVKVLNNG